MPDALLVVRAHEPRMLGILGHFDEAATARLEALSAQIEHSLSRLRYVTYDRAEEDCRALATRLLERLGSDEVGRASFTAIPRGGLIVLGMLSYLLEIGPDRLRQPTSRRGTLVVVDDCALSGLRFREFLRDRPHPRIVFATLYSHPDLRRAIEERETRVSACLSARDLTDHAPERVAAQPGLAAWRRRARETADPGCYWVGQPDHVCFPWSEPDVTIWNPVTARREAGWRVLPPELCLKNRPRETGRRSGEPRIQVQPPGSGRLRPGPRILFGSLEEGIVVADVATGESVLLPGVAGTMWQALVRHGDPDAAAASLAVEYRDEESRLRGDMERFAGKLVARGLLEEAT